jgi:hypothetical protein
LSAGVLDRWAPRIFPPLGYLLCALVAYSRWLMHPTQGVPGAADGLLYSWYFSWTEYSLVHFHNPLITNWLNAPIGINAMWNTGVFGLTVLFAPITYLFGPIAATGLAMMLSVFASASTCYFVLRRITHTTWAPAFVSLIYGFGPFFVAQAGHLHLIFAVFPPLILYFGHKLFVETPTQPRPIRTGIALGVVVGLQLITGEEVLVLTALPTLVAVLALAAINPAQIRQRAGFVLRSSATAIVVAIVIAAIPVGLQFFGPSAIHGGFPASGQRLGVAGFVVPGEMQYFASQHDIYLNKYSMPANGIENTGYLGWPLLAVVLASCVWLIVRRERFLWWWLVTTGATVIFSLGTVVEIDDNHIIRASGPWSWVRNAPLLNGVVAVRFTLITTLLVVLLLAWTLARLPRGKWRTIGVVVVLAAMVALWPSRRATQIQRVVTPRFFTTAALDRIPAGATTLLLPVTNNPNDGARVMLWQERAHQRIKVVGGWGVFVRDGKASYDSYLPEFVGTLDAIGRSGVAATSSQISSGATSVAGSGIQYIVLTNQQANASSVASAASAMAGCVFEQVADVQLCKVGQR